MTTILDCHLRWKGEEDGNPGPGVTEYGVVLMFEGVGEFGGEYNNLLLPGGPMARKNTPAKIQKAQRTLTFNVPDGTSYIDIAQALSMVNRKLYRQGMVYGIESIEFGYIANPTTVDIVRVQASVAGDTWSVHNAHVKGKALWDEMNQLVLEDNPSVAGTWADYKLYLDNQHVGAGANLQPVTQAGGYLQGEWGYSTYVMPQHIVNTTTGEPLAADETFGHLIGPNVGSIGAFTSVGLVKAYQESRATVQPEDPSVPAGMSESFFNLLTDSGSQEPELADVIEAENDRPPYDQAQYPGGAFNAITPVIADVGYASVGSPHVAMASFVAQCGLIKITNESFENGAITPSTIELKCLVTLMPGKYKGVAALPMGQ